MSGDRSSGQSERPTERPTERQAERPPASGRNSPEHTLEDDPVALALNRVRAAARAKGLRPGSPAAPAGSAAARRAAARQAAETPRSGAHPDGRDPQLLGSGIDRLVTDRGWQAPVAVGGVIGRWEAVVGAEIAAHCRPETFRDGVLSVRAESTTWATQLKLLVPTILSRLSEEVGEGVVERVVVQGPNAPSWRRGPWTASGGLGPRDTYG